MIFGDFKNTKYEKPWYFIIPFLYIPFLYTIICIMEVGVVFMSVHENSCLNQVAQVVVLHSFLPKVSYFSCKTSLSLMVSVVRFEQCRIEYLDAYGEWIEPVTKSRWFPFLHKFSGFNVTVTKTFALSFNGKNAHIGDIYLQLYEQFISQAAQLPLDGERWLKGKHIKGKEWKKFNPSMGFPLDWLKINDVLSSS